MKGYWVQPIRVSFCSLWSSLENHDGVLYSCAHGRLLENALTFCFKDKEHFWWWNCEHEEDYENHDCLCVCSWNIGPAHIISFSTEVYFYLEYGLDLLFRQYEWLKKDLEVWIQNTSHVSLDFTLIWLWIMVWSLSWDLCLFRKQTDLSREPSVRGSSLWHTDPCTALMMMETTVHASKVTYVSVSVQDEEDKMRFWWNLNTTILPILGSPWT